MICSLAGFSCNWTCTFLYGLSVLLWIFSLEKCGGAKTAQIITEQTAHGDQKECKEENLSGSQNSCGQVVNSVSYTSSKICEASHLFELLLMPLHRAMKCTHRIVLSTLFCMHELTHDWVVLLWLTEKKKWTKFQVLLLVQSKYIWIIALQIQSV